MSGGHMILYFSGTGNSEWCARVLANELHDECVNTFDFIKNKTHETFTSGTPWIFVVPTYAWRVPRIFKQFLERSTFYGSRDVYFVMTCGGDDGNAQKSNAALAHQIGLTYKGTLEVVMPENYIALFDVPAQDVIDTQFANAHALLVRAAQLMDNCISLTEKETTVVDSLKSGIVNTLFYPTTVHAKKFTVSDACIGCRTCEELCPLNAITLTCGHPVWKDTCTHCMACIAHCPVKAIEYGDATQGKVRYTAETYAPKALRR